MFGNIKIFILIFIFTFTPLVYSQSEIKLTLDEKQYLQDNTFTVNTTANWEPFNFKNENNELVGMGIDYWNLISKKVGIKSKYIVASSFNEVLNNIKNKTYDLNMATTKSGNKEKYSIFSLSYDSFPIAIATIKDTHITSNAAMLEGKRVAVGENYSAYFLLKEQYPKINFVFTKNTKEALKLVENKEAFACIDIEPSLHSQVHSNNFKGFHISTISNVDFDIQIMINDDLLQLQTIVNKAISMITKEEKIEIYKKWMTFNKTIIDYTLVCQIFFIFSIINIVFFIAYYKQQQLKKNLKIQVKQEIEKNKQQQLLMLQQSRLAQMGEMISMIAHQWRQPLNTLSVLNQAVVVKYNRKKLDDKSVEYFQKNSSKQIQNMSKTIDDFKNFFKPEKEKLEFCINKVITDTIDMVKPILDVHGINIIFDVNIEFKTIGYQNELGQGILNIINNSKDALIQNNIKNKEINILLKEENNNIIITICDNAGGISEDIIDQIFDPYFSTKCEKNGTGLGLYMTKIIIEEHMDGKINVSNDKDGAVFQIKLWGVNDE